MAAKYELGSIGFKSKKSIMEYAQAILHNGKINNPISGNDYLFIADLLEWHPKAKSKLKNMESIHIKPNSFGNPAFFVQDVFGRFHDVSYRKCIYPPSPITKFSEACRRCVDPYVLRVKNLYFDDLEPKQCEATGKMIERYEAHVDHAPPWVFSKIVRHFIDDNEIDINSVEYERGREGAHFLSTSLQVQFITYHNKRANLRIVDGEWNIKAGTHEKEAN